MDIIHSDTSAETKQPVDVKQKLAVCLWVSLLIVGFLWFTSKIFRGRQRMRHNFDTIEEQLKRIQSVIDKREKENLKEVAEAEIAFGTDVHHQPAEKEDIKEFACKKDD